MAGLHLAHSKRPLVDDPADVKGLPVLALARGHRVRRDVSARVGDPGTVEVAEDLVVGDGVLGTSPGHVGGAVACEKLAGDEPAVVVRSDDVDGLAVVFSPGERARGDITATGWHPADLGRCAACAGGGSTTWK